jgi:hypothetical protein
VSASPRLLRSMAIALAMMAVLYARSTRAMDLFGVDNGPPSSPSTNALLGTRNTGCVFGKAPTSPLSLDEAIERALCSNPRTREAWATVKLQASRLGISKSAYLPTLSLTLERDGSDIETTVPSNRLLDSGGLQLSNTQALVLNWVILDASRGFDVSNNRPQGHIAIELSGGQESRRPRCRADQRCTAGADSTGGSRSGAGAGSR